MPTLSCKCLLARKHFLFSLRVTSLTTVLDSDYERSLMTPYCFVAMLEKEIQKKVSERDCSVFPVGVSLRPRCPPIEKKTIHFGGREEGGQVLCSI